MTTNIARVKTLVILAINILQCQRSMYTKPLQIEKDLIKLADKYKFGKKKGGA